MVYLITGGSGSGKSAYAEEVLMSQQALRKIYIATMQIRDEEAKEKVERHKKLREEKNFETLEIAKNMHEIHVSKEDSVLLECLSNLVANEMFDTDGSKEHCAVHIKKGIDHLIAQAKDVVIVGNEVFSDRKIKDSVTNAYIKALGEVTAYAAKQADIVIEIVYGIPVIWKGQMK